MGKIALVVLSESTRTCEKCAKEIELGEKAVKLVSRKSSSGGSWATTIYLHEKCWTPKRNQNY